MCQLSATYSPEDNKLRLYASARLDADTYARVKAAGFRWAPRQELFVAPAWTPEREDLLLELCGTIDDEDKSLAERQEERAERFEKYSDKRANDADAAREYVRKIADNIPFGQPILVGHHSEKHARKDAERIERGMKRAVNMWRTSKYWTDRAAGAIAHAKYKERPDVRARRIKGLEAEARKLEKANAQGGLFARLWAGIVTGDGFKDKTQTPEATRARALFVANYGHSAHGYGLWSDLNDGKCTPLEAQARALEAIERETAWRFRWLEHTNNRLAYERAMQGECGGTAADKTKPEQGGAVKCWASHRGAWSYVQKVNKVTVTVLDNWGNGGANFKRTIPFDKLTALMSAADVAAAREAGRLVETTDGTGFYLHEAEEAQEVPAAPAAEKPAAEPAADADFEAMAESLRAGVKTVAAPQLFPTPRAVARELVNLADVRPGNRVLEPSAGTGELIRAAFDAMAGADCGRVVAVELNGALVRGLEEQRNRTLYANESNFKIVAGDFLEQTPDELGTFDRIVMNPPFEHAADVKHVLHALRFLKPGGKLAAIVAGGPRQLEKLQPLASSWQELPSGTFAGTGVRSVMLTMDADALEQSAAA